MTIRVHELAKELGVDRQELVARIQALELDVTVDNYMSALSLDDVIAVREALGVGDPALIRHRRVEPLLGVWKHESTSRGGRRVISSATHLVFGEETLFWVRPDTIRYEDEEGPQRRYEVEWVDEVARLRIDFGARPDRCGLARVVDRAGQDELRIRWGGVAGTFPDSIHDESGTIEKFVPETDPVAAERVRTPPEPVARPTRQHPTLGKLSYDENLHYWRTRVEFGQTSGVRFSLTGPVDLDDAAFDRAATVLEEVDDGVLRRYAANDLFTLHNDSWCDPGDEVDVERFIARMSPESFGVQNDGSVSVYYADGDLFWGHHIYVYLDDDLRPFDAGIAG